MIVTNNRYGISTPFAGQHGYDQISERGRAFGMPVAVVDGNDPEASHAAIAKALDYVRTERKPYLLEAMVSRLRGHSSASGANVAKDEIDCLDRFEHKLVERNLITRAQIDKRRDELTNELAEAGKRVRLEPAPEPSSVYDYVFADKNYVGGER
jgi:2-oxoisovalerate dehydrogenase E1 component alpha subunit